MRKVDGLEGVAGEHLVYPHREKDDPTRVEATLWQGNAGQAQVELVRIDKGGHIEPSLTERYRPRYEHLVGPQNHDLEAAEVAWQFFRDKQAH